MRRFLKLSVVPVASALVLAACGSSTKNSAAPTTASGGNATTAAPASQFPAIPAGPIKFGLSLSLSGSGASYGLNAQKSFQISLSEFNKYNPTGIDGHKVQLDIVDDGSDVTRSVAAANQFVHDKDAFVLKVSDNPEAAIQQAAVLNKAKIPIQTYAGTVDFANTAKWPYLFGPTASADQTGAAAAKYIAAHPQIKRIAVLDDGTQTNNETVSTIIGPLKTDAPSVQVVKTATVPPGTVDASAAVSQLKASNPDLVIVALSLGFGPIWQAIRAANWTPTIMTSAGAWYDGFNAMGPLATKALAPYVDCVEPGHAPFSQQITGIMDGYYSLLGSMFVNYLTDVNSNYMELELARAAIEKYNSVSPDAIKQAIEGMTDTTLLGLFQYSFSPTRHFGLTGTYGPQVCHMAPLVDGKYNEPTIAH